MKVVVRTHGGLGNQIFQLLYGRLYAITRGATLFELHDLRYPHAFGRSTELTLAPRPGAVAGAISALRLPKIATRLGLRRDGVRLLGTTYLDGYFQRVEAFAEFDDSILQQELLRLRNELGISTAPDRGRAVHLRLGDFFTSEAAVVAHLDERLQSIEAGASIITNDEQRLGTPAIAAMLASIDARIVRTGDMTPEQVLRTLARFRHVDGNDSTLLFWASVLSGMECAYRNPELRDLRERFLRALEIQR